MNKSHKDQDEVRPAQPETAEAQEAGRPEQPETGDLQARIEAQSKEIAELKDKYLRALADGENARKRIRQQSEENIRLQKEALLRDLLPIVDNLERAVEAGRGAGGDGQILQGVEMVLRLLLDYLKVQGVTPIPSAGQSFDPSRHEAIDHIESDSHPPNTVIQEFHRGYLIGDKILRPARVTVAKSGASGRSDSEGDVSEIEKN